MLENSPDFVWTWLGLAKAGLVSALINTNLKGISLSNVLQTSNASAFIIGKDFIPLIQEAIQVKDFRPTVR